LSSYCLYECVSYTHTVSNQAETNLPKVDFMTILQRSKHLKIICTRNC